MEIEVPVDMTIEATDTVNVPTPVPVDYDHARLRNRDKPKQHPIHAIERLPETLAGKVDVEPNHSLMSDAEHVKLSGIQAGAQVNLIESVKVNGSPLTINGKAVDVKVPTVYAKDIQYDQTKGIIKLIGADGSVIGSIDTNLERVIKSGRYDTAKQELVFVTDDGSEIRVPVGDLVDTYTGDNTTITVADNTFSVAKAVMDQINSKANDADVVHKAGAETIDGPKTFTAGPSIENNTPLLKIKNTSVDTGVLPSTTYRGGLYCYDKSNLTHRIEPNWNKDGSANIYTQVYNNDHKYATDMTLFISADGKLSYLRAPETPSGSNGREVVTAGYLNSAPTVVHTTGNETVGGVKSYVGQAIYDSRFETKITMRRDDIEDGVASPYQAGQSIRFVDKNNKRIGHLVSSIDQHNVTLLGLTAFRKDKYDYIGVGFDANDNVYSYAPTPSADANGHQIVTAGWANGKYVKVDGTSKMTNSLEFADGWDVIAHCQYTNVDGEVDRYHHGSWHTTYDKDNRYISNFGSAYDVPNTRAYMDVFRFFKEESGEETQIASTIRAYVDSNRNTYGTSSYRTSGQTSQEIVTFGMVPTLADIVHTTGNQTIAGEKEFTAMVRTRSGLTLEPTGFGSGGYYITDPTGKDFVARYSVEGKAEFSRANMSTYRKINGVTKECTMRIVLNSDGTMYADAPWRTSGWTNGDVVTYGMLKTLGLIKG